MNKETPIHFIAIVKANYIHTPYIKGPVLLNAHIGLEISDNLDPAGYFIGDSKIFNKDGSIAYTLACVEGLITNIHTAHQKGWRDSAEHLRAIIDHLQEGFLRVMGEVKSSEKTVTGNINTDNSNV